MTADMRLSWRLMVRDFRSGELWLLVLALLMAVSVSTAIALFSDRLQQGLGRQVADIIGADMVITSPAPLQERIATEADAQGLASSRVLEFPSVVVAGDAMQLVAAKAVEDNYPLRGNLRGATRPFEEDAVLDETPAPGEAWLEPRLFSLLGLETGDRIQLGEIELTVTRALTQETDTGGDFSRFSPRLLFNMADVAATAVVQPGSRIHYKTLFAGDARALQQFRSWAEDKLDASEELIMAKEGRRDLKSAVARLQQFLGLASLAAMLLAGIAVAMASRRFAQRRFDTAAIIRCLGGSRRQALSLFLLELIQVALLVALPGMLLGWLMQAGLVTLLQEVLPGRLPQPGPGALAAGYGTGLLTLLGFGLTPLLQLQQVSPLRILRRELTPPPPSTFLAYALSLTSLLLLLWYFTGQLWMTIVITLAGAGSLMAVSFGIQAALRALDRRISGRPLALSLRLVFKRIIAQRSQTAAQLLAFSLTLLAMAIVLVIRTDLLDRWQQDLPQETPNYFALNIQPDLVEPYREFLSSHAISSSALYPVVRGRLVQINGVDVYEAVPEGAQGHNAINRELSLTWADRLPDKNRLLSGNWWAAGSTQGLSLEESVAQALGIKRGDLLTLRVSGRDIEARVTSIRAVQWESFKPNFYMILPQGALEGLPVSWLNSFHLDTPDKRLANQLITQLPTLTLLDLDAVIRQLRHMLEQSIVAVEAILGALLFGGLLVLASVVESGMDQRLKEGALLRSLGASRRQLTAIQAGEFLVLGIVSGVIAAAGTELCSFWLNTRVFELGWQPVWWLWPTLPLAGALVIGGAGWLGTRRVVLQSPSRILREG